jgi:prephenate dehydratase
VRSFSRRPRVAFQGEPGAFSEDAAVKLLGSEIDLVPRATMPALFCAIDEGLADYALVPIENTLVGPIQAAVELLHESRLVSAAEVELRIEQQLIGCPGAALADIEAVESHPAALAQCQNFFMSHPRLIQIEAEDTAGSVARIMRNGERARAALASKRAAEMYGGAIIRQNVEDSCENYTRFVLLHSP